MRTSLLCVCVIVSLIPVSQCFEPITTSVFIGISALLGGYSYFDQIKEKTYCKFRECCIAEDMPFDILSLQSNLSSR